jgi:hypothetical protein
VQADSKTGLFVCVAIMFAIGLLNTGCGWQEGDLSYFDRVKPGMTSAEIREIYGTPEKEYSKSTAPDFYYVKGYAYEKREISNIVYVYIYGDAICYVYIDVSNKVEHVFIGGS